MRYILHYTEPGDLVFDGFSGTGMTGVAAQMCGNRAAVNSLGLQVLGDGTILDQGGVPFSKLGKRLAVLNDLSPAATFISYNYNAPPDMATFGSEADRILAEMEAEWGWMYETRSPHGPGRINYTVWSEVFSCPQCNGELVYFDAAVDKANSEVLDTFHCPHCQAELEKRSLLRCWESYYDPALGIQQRVVKYLPALIRYECNGSTFEKKPDEADLAIIEKIRDLPIPAPFPVVPMPPGERRHKDGYHLKGISHVHHFYLKRSLMAFAILWQKASGCSPLTKFLIQGNALTATKMNRYRATAFSQVNQYMSGTLFVGSLLSEVSPRYSLTNKTRRVKKLQLPGELGNVAINCGSTTCLASLTSQSIDYVFVDPPFGNNLHYAELNFIWESWLNIFTNRDREAVMDVQLHRTLLDYEKLMTASFRETIQSP
jgi:hypothetical protein